MHIHMHIHIHIHIHIHVRIHTYLHMYANYPDTLTNYDRPQWKAVFSELAEQHAGEKVCLQRRRGKPEVKLNR